MLPRSVPPDKIRYRCDLDGVQGVGGFQFRYNDPWAVPLGSPPDTGFVTVPAGGIDMPGGAEPGSLYRPLVELQCPNMTPELTAAHPGVYGVPAATNFQPVATLPAGGPYAPEGFTMAGAEVHLFFYRLRILVQITDGSAPRPSRKNAVVVENFVIDTSGLDRSQVFHSETDRLIGAPGAGGAGVQLTDSSGVATMIGYYGYVIKLAGETAFTGGEGAFANAVFYLRGRGDWFWRYVYRQREEMGLSAPTAFNAAAGTLSFAVQGAPHEAAMRQTGWAPVYGHGVPASPKGYWQFADFRIRDDAGAPVVGATVTFGPYSGVTVDETIEGDHFGRAVIPCLPLGSTLDPPLGDVQPGHRSPDFPLLTAGGYPGSVPVGAPTPPRVIPPDGGGYETDGDPIAYASVAGDTLTGVDGLPPGGYTGGEWATLPYTDVRIEKGGVVYVDHGTLYVYEDRFNAFYLDGAVVGPAAGGVSLDIDRLGRPWVAWAPTAGDMAGQVVLSRQVRRAGEWEHVPIGPGSSPFVKVEETHAGARVNVIYEELSPMGDRTGTLKLARNTANGRADGGGWTVADFGMGTSPALLIDKSSGRHYYTYTRAGTAYMRRSDDGGLTALEPDTPILTGLPDPSPPVPLDFDPDHAIVIVTTDGTTLRRLRSTDNGRTFS